MDTLFTKYEFNANNGVLVDFFPGRSARVWVCVQRHNGLSAEASPTFNLSIDAYARTFRYGEDDAATTNLFSEQVTPDWSEGDYHNIIIDDLDIAFPLVRLICNADNIDLTGVEDLAYSINVWVTYR